MGKLQNYLNALSSLNSASKIESNNKQSKINNTYTGPIVTQVRGLQANYNLNSDGVIGKQTLELLNTPLSKRAFLCPGRWRKCNCLLCSCFIFSGVLGKGVAWCEKFATISRSLRSK
jgi:hypothetical protein